MSASPDSTPFSPTLVRPAPEVVATSLQLEAHDDEVGDLLLALLGFDEAVTALAASTHPRAGAVLVSILSWLLLD